MIREVLAPLGLDSLGAVNLLMGTAAHESKMGTFWYQIGGGPALGVFQMEPETERDIWDNYLAYRPELSNKVCVLARVTGPSPWNLKYNLAYQIIMARLKYYRNPAPLPAHDDVEGLAKMWKAVYNTPLGAGTEAEFITNYKEMVT